MTPKRKKISFAQNEETVGNEIPEVPEDEEDHTPVEVQPSPRRSKTLQPDLHYDNFLELQPELSSELQKIKSMKYHRRNPRKAFEIQFSPASNSNARASEE